MVKNSDNKDKINNKKLLYLIGILASIVSLFYIVIIILVVPFMKGSIINHIIVIGSTILFFLSAFISLYIETKTVYYKCNNCDYLFIPSFKSVFLAGHIGYTRKLKCPSCKCKCWDKKVYSKNDN